MAVSALTFTCNISQYILGQNTVLPSGETSEISLYSGSALTYPGLLLCAPTLLLLLLSPQYLPQAETLVLPSPFCPETQLRCKGGSEAE